MLIYMKNADYSAGRLAGYMPPVAGASTVAFVGDSDPNTRLRNFGSGAPLTETGAPTQTDAAFRRFDIANFLTLPSSYYTASCTILAVHRSVTPITGFSAIVASERDYLVAGGGDGGRRGMDLLRNSNTETVSIDPFGTSAGASTSQPIGPAGQTGAQFNAGTVAPKSGGGVSLALYRRTATQAQATGTNVNTTLSPMGDEASYPFRVGNTYRSVSLVAIDVGFVAVFPRVLTLAEIDLMYASVAKRFTALGFPI